MKKLSALLLVGTLMMSASLLAGCENKAKNEAYEDTKSTLAETKEELDKIKQNREALDKYIANLKSNINDLKVENQKLIAETKRLEAEIIDLNLEMGKIPNSDSGKDLSDDASKSDAPAEDKDSDKSNSTEQEA